MKDRRIISFAYLKRLLIEETISLLNTHFLIYIGFSIEASLHNRLKGIVIDPAQELEIKFN